MRDGMHLGQAGLLAITTSYAALIALFSWRSYHILTVAASSEASDLGSALIAACSASLCVSPLFYLRKLYKDLFAGLGKPRPQSDTISSSATIIYFLSRPVFAVIISSIFVVIMYAGIRQFSIGHVGVNSDFTFLTFISSSIISIATGSAVSRIEDMAKSGHTFMRLPM